MKPNLRSGLPIRLTRNLLALICVAVLVPGDMSLFASSAQQAATAGQETAAKIPPDQLDSLVAPIALYPDPMLAQVLAASTYPLEIIQLQQWLEKNKNLKDKALVDAVSKQPWDASVQAMAALPDVVKRLANDIQWTTDLGNAFLTQQSDVMDAVQRMRKKAKDNGNLKSTEQQKVETTVVENKQVIVVQQASPEVVYVPSYNPTVVYGAPVYPYPPITYPPPGYYAAGLAISFGVGVAMGAAWGGGWGWGCGWGNNDVDINVNNNFNRNTNVNGGNRTNVSGGNRASTQPARGGNAGNKWQHNPQHRGGAPYSDRATANKYGGTARGDSMSNRQANARQNQAQRGGRQQAGVNDRSSPGGRQEQAALRDRSASGGRDQPGASDRSAGSRDSGSRDAGTSDRGSNRGGGGGGDRVGNRSTSSGGGSRSSGAFGGSSGGFSGSSARASSSRGSSSMGGRGGGGGGRRR
jgi:Protein of unknown function (DUF3300)